MTLQGSSLQVSHEGQKALLSFTLLITDRAQVKGISASANDKAIPAREMEKAEEAGCGDPLLDGTHGTAAWAPGRGVAGEAAAKQRCLATLLLGGELLNVGCDGVVTDLSRRHRETLAWECFGVFWDWPTYPRCHLLLCI